VPGSEHGVVATLAFSGPTTMDVQST